jgi:23S rRNA (uracil1939-C5)-methyltransferase
VQVTLTAEKMIHGARTLARLTDGRIALLRGALPGETVDVTLTQHKGVLQGAVMQIHAAHPSRTAASIHPGLDYSHIRYESQLEFKQTVVKDALGRALKQDIEVPPVRAAPSLWHYRNTVQPVVQPTGLGYRRPESHEVVLLPDDPVAMASLNAVWQHFTVQDHPKGIREIVLRGNDDGEVLIAFIAAASAKNYLDFAHELLRSGVTGVSYAPYDARGRFRSGSERLSGKRSIMQRYGDYTISVSAHNFAQPNPQAASALYKTIQALAPGGQHALDLYAGSGVIGMHLAGKYQQATVLEIDRSSVTRGKQDAERLGISNLQFVRATAKTLSLPAEIDLITVDPPRSGLSKEVRATLTQSTAATLIYVSCDVATWARDVADLSAQGWQLTTFEPFDFYPQTHHIELLSVLQR